MAKKSAPPLVGIIMGSKSDWRIMSLASEKLDLLSVPHECKIVSAHRTAEYMFDYAKGAQEIGIHCIIAGAGGAAHLPGMVSALTTLPVLGVPMPTRYLSGQDSLLSIVQMPAGVPVATFAVGEAGAVNAALYACSILALSDESLAERLREFRKQQQQQVLNSRLSD